MNIRSITYFMDPGFPIDMSRFERIGMFVKTAQEAFEGEGYNVQTVRLATTPFPQVLPDLRAETVVDYARTLERVAGDTGCSYMSLGPALPDYPASYPAIPFILAETENVFASGIMASRQNGISLYAIRACAEIIQEASTLDPDGFGNLYFTASANVGPGSPFFPAAYHDGGEPGFALAMEAADVVVRAFSQSNSLAEARQNLIESIETHASSLVRIGESLAKKFGVIFKGLDFTPAPFPSEAKSIATAIEQLGVPAFGLHGSLAGAAFVVDTIDQACYPKVGFNGLMTPVLEDYTLARRVAEGSVSLKDLLMYSAVCGTGLDTIPLPGDTGPEILAAVLLDVASLAQRLAKPLTARLMPIPGKQAGESTTFDFPFFANSRVMAVEAQPLHGLFGGDESFSLRPR